MIKIQVRPVALAAALLVSLAGCGGGGSSSSGGGSTDTGSTSQTLAGTVAKGAAWTGVVVTAKCATGTYTSVPTSSTGAYSISIPSGALPCVLEASDGSTRLHSVATTTTAQVTPLTELLVAQLAGTDPSSFMNSVSASSLATTLTPTAISNAQTQVLAVLTAAGVSTSGVTDLVAGSLTAGSGSGYDGVLDALASSLSTSGTSLTALTGTVAASSGGTPTASTSPLAPELLLKPASASCNALRATDYWVINTGAINGAAIQKIKIQLTADKTPVALPYPSLEATAPGTTAITLTANGACRFTTSDGGDVMVSPSGIFIGTDADARAFVGVPVQAHTLAELAGDWNMIGSDTDDAAVNGIGWNFGYGTVTLSAAGYQQFTQGCWYGSYTATTCTALPDAIKARKRPVALLADGSFTVHSDDASGADGGPWMDRSFVYRTGQGDYLAIGSNVLTGNGGKGDGSVSYGTKVRTLALPTVGAVSSNWAVYWNWITGTSTVATDVNTHTIQSVDSSAGSYVRVSGVAGAATHAETLFSNQPFAGFQRRDQASGVATSDGKTTNVRAGTFLRAGSSGFTAVLQPYQDANRPARIVLSAAQPG